VTRVDLDHHAIGERVTALAPELTAFRRQLHAHPELSWQEHQTTATLMARLEKSGLEPRVAPTGTGVLCDIGSGGPLVALRGDIDALPLRDTKAVPYRSTVEGVCHACGHDVHTTTVLGAGLALAGHLDRNPGSGRVRLIFQPAEEVVPGAAVSLVDAGVMHGVEAIYALHCDPAVEVGHVGLSVGPITSAADLLSIRLHGAGGHTARPHRTADIVHIAARIVVDLPMSLARLSDPRDMVNVTFGAIHAGDAANVIPTEASVAGSLRAAGRPSWEAAPERIRTLLAAIVDPLGATWELDHRIGAPPIDNDPVAVGHLDAAAHAVVGAKGIGPTVQSSGGEDFSWYGDHAPAGFIRLGVHTPGEPMNDIHTGGFDVDERAIPIGARILAGAALEGLAALAGD